MNRLMIIPRMLRQIIAPRRCLFCSVLLEEPKERGKIRYDGRLCPDCLSRLIPVDYLFCERCGGIHEPELIHPESEHCCVECLRIRRYLGSTTGSTAAMEPAFDRVITMGVYDGLLGDAILRCKRERGDGLTRLLTTMLFLMREEPLRSLNAELICPIPTDVRSRRERGTNDAERMASVLSELLGIPVVTLSGNVGPNRRNRYLCPRNDSGTYRGRCG
ncbi:MAG: hypothetical protein Q4C47_09885 [Planctomycetia bacterium]|nr:hypothetical protein [Planctomycetia bacterium]